MHLMQHMAEFLVYMATGMQLVRQSAPEINNRIFFSLFFFLSFIHVDRAVAPQEKQECNASAGKFGHCRYEI